MYSNVKRSNKYISRLCDFIRLEYQISPVSLTPAKRGYYGETWRLEAADRNYFVKLDYSPHKKIYERSFVVLDHLRSHGITAVSKIIKSVNGELSTRFDSAVLGVFEWIDGENVQNEATKIEEYKILGKVYAAPTDNIDIQRDKFSAANANLFYRQWDKLKDGASNKNHSAILSVLDRHGNRFRERSERLALFADKCKSDTSNFYITHGDAGGNVIVNGSKFYIVDWDDTRLAPPERDAWFCLHWEWAMTAFNNALRGNGINYTLRPERLAYYCYDMFFFYLNEYMKTYFALGNRGISEKLTEYFNCWIENEILYADNIK